MERIDSTYVAVEFPTASGAVYGLSSICPDVKAWWKNNSTIVIETHKEVQTELSAFGVYQSM